MKKACRPEPEPRLAAARCVPQPGAPHTGTSHLQQPELVVIARIIRPQGRRGEVLADILTDFPDRFSNRKLLFVAAPDLSSPREMRLEEHWFHKGRVVLKFAGVDTISDAEAIGGTLVAIPRNQRAELEPGAVYVSDLVGCALIDSSLEPPREIGRVRDVQQGSGAAPLLLVSVGSRELEIPFAQEFIVELDAARKTLTMKLPQGLLEINDPLTPEEKGLLNDTRLDS